MPTEDTPFTNDLVSAMSERIKHQEPAGGATVTVKGALHKLTALYERIRTLVDYQEERYIRRLAIRRILVRRVTILNERSNIGESLLLELVRAAYIENGAVPVAIAEDIDAILVKYFAALPIIEQRYRPPELQRMRRRLLGIAAAEIEDFLNPATVDYILTNRLAKEIAETFSIENDEFSKMVALRCFLSADEELLEWRLLREPSNAVWGKFTENPAENASALARELTRIEADLAKPELGIKVRQTHRLVPPYIILADLAYHSPKETIELVKNPARMRNFIETTIRRRLANSSAKIQRSMVRATLYILLSKVVMGLPIEFAFDMYESGHVVAFPLIINTLIPPSLMLTAALSLRQPSPENTIALAARTVTLLNNEPLQLLPGIVRDRKAGSKLSTLFSILFLITYLIVFGGIIWILNVLHFNFVSSAIFFVFVSVVGFFAYRLRGTANELLILEEKEGAFLAVFDFFALPFLRLGRSLSITAQNWNVFLFFLDFIVEAPLKLVFVVMEDWFAFLREKREELK